MPEKTTENDQLACRLDSKRRFRKIDPIILTTILIMIEVDLMLLYLYCLNMIQTPITKFSWVILLLDLGILGFYFLVLAIMLFIAYCKGYDTDDIDNAELQVRLYQFFFNH